MELQGMDNNSMQPQVIKSYYVKSRSKLTGKNQTWWTCSVCCVKPNMVDIVLYCMLCLVIKVIQESTLFCYLIIEIEN